MSVLQFNKGRPNDYYYDSSNISSGPKDYYKQAMFSKQTTMKYAICPIFPSMFSDLQNYPCKQYVIRRSTPIPMYQNKIGEFSSSKTSRAYVLGSDRYKYFHNSPAAANGQNMSKPALPSLETTCFYNIDRIRKQVEQSKLLKRNPNKNKKIQTIYRETSSQTSPWQPDYTVIEGDPELLKLDFLKWGEGLPAGMAEVEYIDRMRSKKRSEDAMPAGTSKASLKMKKDVIAELSRQEWANREKDIEEIQLLRLELLERMLNELHLKSKCRNEQKMRSIVDLKLAEKNEKIEKVRKDAEREKRRLKLQFAGVLARYSKAEVYEEHANYDSELYCPLMRNGTNPKYKHEKLCKFEEQGLTCSDDEYDVLPRNLETAAQIGEIKLSGTRLCIRETKWTLPVLKALYEELKEMRIEKKQYPNLRVCIDVESNTILTPEITESDDQFKDMHKSAIYIQKLMRGRAAQNKIFMGRERCHELIDELRGNYALLKGDVCKKARIREKRRGEQLNTTRCMNNMKALEGSLRKLSGSVAGTLFDFLNKDLQRLMHERRAHAMILLVERLRQIREAEEAGRRQKEIQRRKEHDEIFKQVVKVHQDTVDLYLQDIITEGMEFASEEKAREYVETLTEKVNEEQMALEHGNASQIDREEYIAAMVHNFVIPEVEKNIVRDRMKKQHQLHLRNAHNEIYNKIEVLPNPDLPTVSSKSESLETVTQQVVDADTLRKTKETERQTVIDDIRTILDDLVLVPYTQSALKKLIPCEIEQLDLDESTSTTVTTETEADEEGSGQEVGEFESEDEEKFEALDALDDEVTEPVPSDEEANEDAEGDVEVEREGEDRSR